MNKRRVRFRASAEIIDTMFTELQLTGFSLSKGPILQGGHSQEFVDIHLSQIVDDQATLCSILCDYAGKSGWIFAVSLSHEKPVEIPGNDFGRLLSVFHQCHEYSIFTPR